MDLSREKILYKLNEFICALTNDSNLKITENSKIDSLNLDSLHFVQLIIFIESEYDIEIPDEYLIQSDMDSIKLIIDIITELKNKIRERK